MVKCTLFSAVTELHYERQVNVKRDTAARSRMNLLNCEIFWFEDVENSMNMFQIYFIQNVIYISIERERDHCRYLLLIYVHRTLIKALDRLKRLYWLNCVFFINTHKHVWHVTVCMRTHAYAYYGHIHKWCLFWWMYVYKCVREKF